MRLIIGATCLGALVALTDCQPTCAGHDDGITRSHVSVRADDGTAARIDTETAGASLANFGDCGDFSLTITLEVGSPKLVTTLNVRRTECGALGPLRLADLETESCVCTGCTRFAVPRQSCARDVEGTIVVSRARSTCNADDCTHDFVADLTIETSRNVTGTIHAESRITSPRDERCGKSL